jgi:hypothetical protein
MVSAYEQYINNQDSIPDLAMKDEAFQLILSRSMMPVEEVFNYVKLKKLTKEEAMEVLSYFTDEPDPIKVISK